MLGPSSPQRSSLRGWAGLGPQRGTDRESLLTRSSRPSELGASQRAPSITGDRVRRESQQGPALCMPPGLSEDQHSLPGHSSPGPHRPCSFPSVSAGETFCS